MISRFVSRMRKLGWMTLGMLMVSAISYGSAHAVDQTTLEQARKEGKVTWYAQPGTRELLKDQLQSWKERYPEIALEIVELTGPDQMERVNAERRAGNIVADVTEIGDLAAWIFADQDAYQPFDRTKLNNIANMSDRVAQQLSHPSDLFIPISIRPYGIMVNTSLLSEADYPKSWKDLIDPKYKGKILVDDFRRVGTASNWLAYAVEPLGIEYFEKFIDQDLKMFLGADEADAALVRGERAIQPVSRARSEFRYAGAPIKWILPSDGILFGTGAFGIVNGADHPSAAHVLLDFLLSTEVQSRYASIGDVPVIKGVPSPIDFDKTTLLGKGGWEKLDFGSILALGKQLVEGRK